jgi:hypothetical protein
MSESELVKIYTDDKNVPYKSTKINAYDTRTEIDRLLNKWGIQKSGWNWEPEHNNIFVWFEYEEEIMGKKITPPIRIVCPTIWDHRMRGKVEVVNWNVSMRSMHWLIKSLLETAYLWQSAKIVAFLPYVAAGKEIYETLARKVILNMAKIQQMPALEEGSQ